MPIKNNTSIYSADEYKQIINSCGDPMILYDQNKCVTFINTAFEKEFGWDFDELIGSPIDLIPEELKKEADFLLEQIVSGSTISGKETLRLKKDKTSLNVKLSIGVLLDSDGQVKTVVETLQNITDLVQSRSNLLLANKAKGDFLSNVSHEIRTPINGLLGMIDLLDATILNEEQSEYVEVMKNSSKKLMTIVTGILDYSKIESGKIECKIIAFDLRITLEMILETISKRIKKRGLKFSQYIDNQVPSLLKGDPEKLRQILNNILDNAIKFTEKGEIKISVKLEKEDASKAKIKFDISDTGIGISQEKCAAIFDSFTQVDGGTTRKYGGTGIGLSISKQLIDLMSGTIEVKSLPNQGTSFKVSIEFEKQENKSLDDLSIPKHFKDKKILFVDDNVANRLVIKELLRKWGCLFEEAASGSRALEKINAADDQQKSFDIALIDMMMPGMDGETLATQIRQDNDHLIIIMLFSQGKRGDVERLSKIDVQGYLPKPIKPSLLHNCITMAIAMKEIGRSQVITQHFLLENKKHQVKILLVEPGLVNRKVVKNILERSGFNVEIAGQKEKALAEFQSGGFKIVLCETNSFDDEYINFLESFRNIEKEKKFENSIILVMTDYKNGHEENLVVNDYISTPVSSKELLVIIEKWVKKDKGKGQPVAPISIVENDVLFDFDSALERAMDDLEFLELIVNEFIKSVPEKLDKIRDSIANMDNKVLTITAHSLRGSAANIGAENMIPKAMELEKKADVGELDGILVIVDALGNEFERFKDHIETIKWSNLLE